MPSKRVQRALTALIIAALVAADAPAILAYINGGDHHDSLEDFRKGLRKEGWGAGFGPSIPAGGKEVSSGVNVGTPEFDQFVNQLVARAVADSEDKGVNGAAIEIKRQIAKAARDAIQKGVEGQKRVVAEGPAGSFEYQVGIVDYRTWITARERGRVRTYERRSGHVSFVAVRAARPATAEIPRIKTASE